MSSVSALNSLLSGSSSSSIDISSILEAAMGASSSGIDVTAAVNSAVTAARAPETAWQTQQTTLQGQINDLTTIENHVSTLDNDIHGLSSLTGPLAARTATSSNTSLVTASATALTAPGNHTVVVNNLATTGAWTSGTFASSSATLPAGSFTITAGGGGTTTITTDGTQTLADVAGQINVAGLGVTASVVTDATGSRLAIVANSSGSTANFSVGTNSGGFGFTQVATGANASLTVDGIQVSSTTNNVSGVVQGLTLNLVGANPGTTVSVGIAPDTTQIQSAIGQFVTDYNTVISDLNTEFKFNGKTQGPLASDSTVRNLQSQLLGALSYTYTPTSGTTTVPNLTSLGISVQNDGTLALDSSQLQSSLESNFNDVQTFFQGTSANGFANSLDQQLTSFTSPANGAFTVDLQSMNNQVSDLQDSINSFEANYITPLKTQLEAEYTKAEIALQQLPQMMQQINAELGNNNNSKG